MMNRVSRPLGTPMRRVTLGIIPRNVLRGLGQREGSLASTTLRRRVKMVSLGEGFVCIMLISQ